MVLHDIQFPFFQRLLNVFLPWTQGRTLLDSAITFVRKCQTLSFPKKFALYTSKFLCLLLFVKILLRRVISRFLTINILMNWLCLLLNVELLFKLPLKLSRFKLKWYLLKVLLTLLIRSNWWSLSGGWSLHPFLFGFRLRFQFLLETVLDLNHG